jgi:DNA-binding CsgD family transcriptional regulator
VSDNVTTVIGLASPDLFTVEFIYENIHPDDRSRFIAHERKVTEFFNNLPPEKVLKYKVSYDYRLKRADGSYVWILMQTVTIQTSDDGAVIRVLGVQTDISHLKQDNTPCGLSFFGLDGEPSFLNVDVPEFIQIRENELFSVREREILRLMVEGKTSRQIADQLFLSLHTVNTHRKNILAKSDCRNIPELLVKAVRKGWAS